MKARPRGALIVVDDENTRWRRWLSRADDGRDHHLLTLGISSEAYDRAHPGLLAASGVTHVAIGPLADQARRNLQQRYPQFVYELARRPLGNAGPLLELLAAGELNLWWLTETSEKSVFRCSLVNDIYFLELVSLALRQLQCDELWVSVSSRHLRRALRSGQPADGRTVFIRSCRGPARQWLLPRLPFLLALVCRRLVILAAALVQLRLARRCRRAVDLNTVRILLFTSYPNLWLNPFGDGAVDRMYGLLASALNRWKPTAYLALLNASVWRLWRHRR
jgi:hypothetical protein